jgi:hypothetical protein
MGNRHTERVSGAAEHATRHPELDSGSVEHATVIPNSFRDL